MDMMFGEKSALASYGLALSSCMITAPVRKRNIVDIPFADGDLDLMESMGTPRYEMRTVTAVFRPMTSDTGNLVSELERELEGRTMDIVLPDDPQHYVTGRVHVSSSGGSPMDITIKAVCFPWRYQKQETVVDIPESTADVSYTLRNAGTREAVPVMTVDSAILLTIGGSSTALSPGTYQLPALTIPGGGEIHFLAKNGAATIRYREAVL